jgi:hypothetical protein
MSCSVERPQVSSSMGLMVGGCSVILTHPNEQEIKYYSHKIQDNLPECYACTVKVDSPIRSCVDRSSRRTANKTDSAPHQSQRLYGGW